MTTLESLANELLLELFEYLDGVQLLYSFYGLNSRFDALLNYFPHYHLNFQSVSRKVFNKFSQELLPSISNQIVSLQLSDENDNLRQINHFTRYGFTHLKSLTLYNIQSTEFINKITSDCLNFTHLTLISIKLCFDPNRNILDLNKIWSLPNLRYFRWENGVRMEDSIQHLTVTSFTLEYLVLSKTQYRYTGLVCLMMHTPHLRYFHIEQGYCSGYNSSLHLMPQMIKMERFHLDIFNRNIILLENMPNLCHLTGDIKETYSMYGNVWEKTILNYLPKLKVFRFKMASSSRLDVNRAAHELLDSFRSSFWTVEHQWFVRCHWNPTCSSKLIFLYTLPYAFHDFPFNTSVIKYKSTCPYDDEYKSYDQVYKLYYNIHVPQDFNTFNIIFPNIRHIDIESYTNLQFESIIPFLNKIRSINITVEDHKCYAQILSLLNNIKSLDWLKLKLIEKSNNDSCSKRSYLIKIDNQETNEQNFNILNNLNSDNVYKEWKATVKNHSEMLDVVKSIIDSTK